MKSLKQCCNASIWGDQVAPGSRGMTMMNLISCRNFVYIRYRRNSPKRVCSSILWYYILYLLLSAISERISFTFFLCSSSLVFLSFVQLYLMFDVFFILCLHWTLPFSNISYVGMISRNWGSHKVFDARMSWFLIQPQWKAHTANVWLPWDCDSATDFSERPSPSFLKPRGSFRNLLHENKMTAIRKTHSMGLFRLVSDELKPFLKTVREEDKRFWLSWLVSH